MNFEVIEAIRNIIEYLRESEEKHWEELGRPEDHIFNDILKVERYLDEE